MNISQEPCGCASGVSRRRVLQAGLAAAAVSAMAGPGDAMAGGAPQAGSNETRERLRASGVRPVDIHAHYFPETYLEVFHTDGKRFGGDYHKVDKGFQLKVSDKVADRFYPSKFTNLKERIAAMDGQGVAVHALSLTAPMVYLGDEEFSAKLATGWNNGASAAHSAYPDRLVALATLPMQYPDRAIDELNRASKLPGVRGVYMGTNIAGKDLDDPMFEPVFTRIETLDLPLFLHPLNTVGGERLAKYYLSNFLGNPIDNGIAACHLMFGGVLDRHPRLRVCLAHAGGILPILIGRIDRGWKVRPEARGLPRAPSEYLKRFTYDTITHSKPIMEFVINMVGVERIMLGSDFCYDMGYEQPVRFVDELELSSDERRMILGGTAAKTLKLGEAGTKV